MTTKETTPAVPAASHPWYELSQEFARQQFLEIQEPEIRGLLAQAGSIPCFGCCDRLARQPGPLQEPPAASAAWLPLPPAFQSRLCKVNPPAALPLCADCYPSFLLHIYFGGLYSRERRRARIPAPWPDGDPGQDLTLAYSG